MEMIETCRGPVEASGLGVTLAHEHLHLHTEGLALAFPRIYDREAIVDEAVARVNAAAAHGVRSLIDLSVMGMGRDITITRDVAARVPVNIVVATGAFFFDQLPPYFRNRPVEALTEQLVLDITEGIAGSGIKPAVLKCPIDVPGLTEGTEKTLRAVARAHVATGLPIATHTDATLHRGRDQVRILREEGVDLTRVSIGHCGDSDDMDYLFELADTGAFLGMDRFGYDASLPLDRRVKAIVDLCERGHAGKLLVSHDYCCHLDYFPFDIGHPAMTYLFTEVLPALRAGGIDEATIDQFLTGNPRRFLAGE